MSSLVQCCWLDEDNRIVQVTEEIDQVGILVAHVGLNDDLVKVIDTNFSGSMTIILDQKRLLQMARDWEQRQHPYPKNIRWHEDGMKFETLRESHEWAYSVTYNEIGYQYDGYATHDEKIAYSLVYELTRLNTFGGKSVDVFAYEEYSAVDCAVVYRIWVKRYPNGTQPIDGGSNSEDR